MAQKSKFLQWIDYRVRVTIQDNRMLLGTFLAYDKHLNVVLSECEEFRRIKPKKAGEPEKEIKRALGMVIVRGETIVSITAEAPPNLQNKRGDQGLGPGKAQPIDRPGVQLNPGQAQPGLGGVSKGVGQMNSNAMMPGQRPGGQGPGIPMQLPGQIPTGIPGGIPGGLPGQPRPGNAPNMMGMQGGFPPNPNQGGQQPH